MEKLSQSNSLNLLLIIFGVGLLLIVSFGLMKPQRSTLETASRDSGILKKNWFSERTFGLLSGEATQVTGIDIQLIAKLDPFERKARVVQSVEAKPTVVEPEPSPPPTTRKISVVYRGFYRSSDGDPFVYVEVEGKMRVFPINGTLAAPWRITEVDASQLTLSRGEEARSQLPFNRKKSLEVLIKQAP